MDRRLTDRQRAVLDFIARRIEETDVAPSLQEIGMALGGISPTAAFAHVVALEKKGYLRRTPHERRGLEVLRGDPDDARPKLYHLPIVGTIAAGCPIEALEEPGEFLWVESSLARSPDNYILRVRGQSMIGDGIFDGDHVVVQRCDTADDGTTVVALVNGTSATLKRIYREKNRVRLQPANPTHEPIFATDVVVQGRVIAVIRRYP
jgi:repressor LexA